MPQKPSLSQTSTPARVSAPHVQAALARAAQAKLPDRPLPHGPSQQRSLPTPLPARPPQPEHFRRALAPAQAKLPEPPSQMRQPAPHVRDAVASVQRKVPNLPAGLRQPAPHVQAALGGRVQAKPEQRTVPLPATHRHGSPAPYIRPLGVVQRTKIKDLPGFKTLDLCQSYTAKQYKKGTSRYVMLNFDPDWHITFFPRDPDTDPYQESVYTAFLNEDSTQDKGWRHDYKSIGELDFNEFHVTCGKLHKGTAKHFFYGETGNFVREEGAGITDADRQMADKLRATITPMAAVSAYQPSAKRPECPECRNRRKRRFKLL
jgi:hypothetical protein